MLIVLVRLLLVGFLLVADGEPFRFFILRRLKLFSNLDMVQACILDIYLSGMFFYAIALLPFRLFNWIFILSWSLISVILLFIIHFSSLKKIVYTLKTRTLITEGSINVFFSYIFVLAMFIIFLGINLFSVSSLVFGSALDESIHSLHVQVILENNCVPLTLQPYLSEGIIYPQASHVIFAFAFYFLDMEVPKVVLYMTILFKALSVLAAYFLGLKMGFNRTYGIGLSFIFTFISMYPLFITWGGNPFATGFPLFLVCLGLLFSLLHSKVENGYVELLIVGLIFGYAGAIIVSYLQALMGITFLVLVYYVFRKRRVHRLFLECAIVFIASLIPVSPFLYRFFVFYRYPGHNIGLPQDFTGWTLYQSYMNIAPQFRVSQALEWAFENLAPCFPLRVWIIFILAVFILLLWKTKNHESIEPIISFALAIFVGAAVLSFIAFFLPADFGIISWGHQGIIMSISLNILIVAFYAKVAILCSAWVKKRLSRVFSPKCLYVSSILTVIVLALITGPFVYYRFSGDPDLLRSNYWIYAITTADDYNLMLWMKENLSSNAVILVHPFEAGLFIPSISHHRIVYPYSGSTLSESYQTLVSLIENATLNLKTCKLNKTAYELMQSLSISHVFIGSYVAYYDIPSNWVPELFLGNPNFKLVKNFGMAYLFELNYTDPNVVFWDDFEYEVWNRNLWRVFSVGQGLGNVSIAEAYGYNGSKCLKIASEMQPTVLDWYYAYGVSREIFVSNASEVRLSFYLNATQGFSRKDTFAVLISNVYRNQSLVVATTNPYGVYENYVGAVVLNGAEGFFEFKGNQSLSALWQERFNSTLPNQFILEFVSWDLDGIENIAYIDNVQITLIPLSAQKEVG